MEYWVDGYNLILRRGWTDAASLDDARTRLLREVGNLKADVLIWFDARGGQRRTTTRGEGGAARGGRGVRSCFVGQGTADDAIAEALRTAPKGSVTVVTDDRELRGRARQLGGNTIGVDRFLEHVDHATAPASHPHPDSKRLPGERPDPSRPGRVSPKEIDNWMKEMGLTPDWTPEPDP